jgi:hypothetical protein
MQYLSSYTEIFLLKKCMQPSSKALNLFLSQFLVPSIGTFCLTLHNQIATSHINMKITFLLTLETFPFCCEKLISDLLRIKWFFSLVSDASFTHFKLSACHKIFSFSQTVKYVTFFYSFPSALFVHFIYLGVLGDL